jgi:virginiamycin B lyase
MRAVRVLAIGAVAFLGVSVPAFPATGGTHVKVRELRLPHPAIYGLAAGPGATMWYTTYGYVGRVDADLTVHEYPITGDGRDIAAGPDGNMWFIAVISDQFGFWTGYVGRVTPDGAVTESLILGEPDNRRDPIGIVAGPDGAMWFTENDAAKIGRVAMDGTVTEFALSNFLDKPDGIAAGPDGNLWFATEYETSQIGRLTTDGVITLFPTPRFDHPHNIAAGPDGNMWFTEDDAVGRITPDGAITEYPVSTNWYVWDIVSLPPSSLVVTEPGTSELGRVSLTGGVHEYGAPMAASPWALALGPQGRLWVQQSSGDLAILTVP